MSKTALSEHEFIHASGNIRTDHTLYITPLYQTPDSHDSINDSVYTDPLTYVPLETSCNRNTLDIDKILNKHR